MPTPSQIRLSRIQHLVSIARAFLEAGASTHSLAGRLERSGFILWPEVRWATRRSYVTAALREVLSHQPVTSDLIPEAVHPQEAP